MSANCVTVLIRGCVFLLLLALPIAEITLGVLYLHDCPVSPLIPVNVMVCGIMAILLVGLIALAWFDCYNASESYIWTVCLISVTLFLLSWFIYGSYLVYSIYPPNYIKSSNSSSLDVSAADLKPEPYNQLQNLQSLSQTGTIYQSNPPAAPHCDRSLYLFAFWRTTVVLSVLGLIICVPCMCRYPVCAELAVGVFQVIT